jgi:hypothetical protein
MDAHHVKSDAAQNRIPTRPPSGRYRFDIASPNEDLCRGVSKQLPWLILLFGGLISAWAAWNIHSQIEREARTAFQMHAFDFQTSIATRLRNYDDIVFGIAGFITIQTAT